MNDVVLILSGVGAIALIILLGRYLGLDESMTKVFSVIIGAVTAILFFGRDRDDDSSKDKADEVIEDRKDEVKEDRDKIDDRLDEEKEKTDRFEDKLDEIENSPDKPNNDSIDELKDWVESFARDVNK